MPMQYVEPEVAFQVTNSEGKTWIIYYTYKNNNIKSRYDFWYTTDVQEREEFEFDIRCLLKLQDRLTPLQRYGSNSDQLLLQLGLSIGFVTFKDNLLVLSTIKAVQGR